MLNSNFVIRPTLSVLAVIALWLPKASWAAADSYRWFHVTIETPWAIFLFLMPLVVAPLVLMVILYWRFTLRPKDKDGDGRSRGPKDIKSSVD